MIIGGGLAGLSAGVELLKVGKSCAAVSEGLSLNNAPREEFVALGGVLFSGDSVVRGEFDSDRLVKVFTRNLENTPLAAQSFILSTGKFFSGGLRSTKDIIYEPIFGADVEYDHDPAAWCSPDINSTQPFECFGLATDSSQRVMISGRVIENLYAAGEILSGQVEIINSALEVCRRII